MDVREKYLEAKNIHEELQRAEKSALKIMQGANFDKASRRLYEAVKEAEDQAWHNMYWAERDFKAFTMQGKSSV